jgi:molecular chaperone DnaJ
VHPHPLFRREGPHLIAEYPISVSQAALGAEIEVPSLNGRVSMKIPPGTQSGTVFRVKGKGVSDVETGRAGDLLVRAVVETPTNLNAAQRKILGEFSRVFGDESHPQRRSFVAKLKDVLKK